MNRTVKKYLVCLFFSFDLLILVWLSEMLRSIIMATASGGYNLSTVSVFILFVFGIIPLFLLGMWFYNPLVVKNPLATFGLAEKSLDKKKEKKD